MDIGFLQVNQHCVATGAPLQEDVSDLNQHGKRVRMISILLSAVHPAGRGVVSRAFARSPPESPRCDKKASGVSGILWA
jgi:hypothetical protein